MPAQTVFFVTVFHNDPAVILSFSVGACEVQIDSFAQRIADRPNLYLCFRMIEQNDPVFLCSLFSPLHSPAGPLPGAVSVELDVDDV